MDLQSLSNLFATTYNPDPNVQKAGELQIRKVGVQEGMIAALLQIIGSENVDLATRQAGVVYLKNRVYTSYFVNPEHQRPDLVPIPLSDRNALKQSILPLLSASPSKLITVQLASTLKNIVSRDFPEQWPTLLPEVKQLLASNDVRHVSAGCVAVLEMVRAFRFRTSGDILPSLIAELFPTLVSIATQLLATPPANASAEIPFMLHMILKSYKTSIMLNLSAHQQSRDSLVPWGHLLFQVVNLQIPAEAVPEDEEERERSEWWKAKKWAYGILGRLFHRFGNPSQLPSSLQKEYGEFAQHFVSTFAPEIFKVYLQQVELYVSGQAWLSKKCQYQIFTFFTECVKPKSTWAMLKPHFQTLVSSYVFPQMSFTPAKKELWETDPIDYIRTSVDEYETFDTPVSAATSFLFSLASNRTKTTFLPILQFINRVLAPKPAPAQRFGALNMTAALGPFIMRHPQVKDSMEQFMIQHVLPEFSSPEPFLRAIACEVLGTIEKAGIKWSNDQVLSQHFTAVAALIDDSELPVRIQACMALTEMVTVHDSVRATVAPQVGKVILTLLKLSEETDLDILNSCMETMVEQYHAELLPVAAELTARLCDTYARLARDIIAAEEADGRGVDLDTLMDNDSGEDKTFAAMGVAKTIGTIVSSVDSSPEILVQIQEVIIPIIVLTLENKLLDLFDNMFDLIDSLTFKLRSISPNMWPVFELTYKIFKTDAIDFLEEMLPSLDNFISFGGDVFKARPDYRQMMLDIYTTSNTSDHLGENDAVNGCKLAESLMLELRGHVDEAIPIIITTSLSKLRAGNTTALRLANLELLINAVLYNAAAALHIMESQGPGTARKFFDQWFEAINADRGLPRVHDKKLSIMALCACLEMDPAQIPDSVKEGWPGIVAGALRIFKDLPKAIAARKELEEAFQAGDDDDSDTDESRYFNLNEEDEDVWDEDSAYIEMLANEGARLRDKSARAAAGEDDESDISSVSDIAEELGYISPLDNVDPYVSFKHALTAFQMKNPQGYQLATTSLSAEQQTLLMEVMRIAEQNSAQGQAA
ncbi:ARM repeat-containing protein [Wolfiporia cocos MD-104 SS10]|uniref:ARM repeat-containing protein n=1 Tax=Wolfiporia cocos (strain MD-104) TaxID=742152 RepID=A0A2H3JD53_WOLCO|nr:ARM repeat-containing protein [Wolfiporia cocos MD-104 SS10]